MQTNKQTMEVELVCLCVCIYMFVCLKWKEKNNKIVKELTFVTSLLFVQLILRRVCVEKLKTDIKRKWQKRKEKTEKKKRSSTLKNFSQFSKLITPNNNVNNKFDCEHFLVSLIFSNCQMDRCTVYV